LELPIYACWIVDRNYTFTRTFNFLLKYFGYVSLKVLEEKDHNSLKYIIHNNLNEKQIIKLFKRNPRLLECL